MEPLKLAQNKQEWFFIVTFLALLFTITLFSQYLKFQDFKSDEIVQTEGKILNIYPKEKRNILKIETKDFTFFTAISKNERFQKFDTIRFIVLSQKITFSDYLKGFYANSFSFEKIEKPYTNVEKLNQKIANQHENEKIASLFNTLFFATGIDKDLQTLSASYGIAHVIAISGFHLGIISFVSYWILNLLYSPFHQKYFPYRNKKFDILIVISIFLFIYLLAINMVPSFLRSFAMFIFGVFLLRSNIKIISFQSLAIIILALLALFPNLLFSLSFWFSIAGVFYIFLFIQYFSHLNKYVQFGFFNFWIFFAINPITHYFFGTTSLVQLLSPFITIGFTVFYPAELFLHIINQGDFLDALLLFWIETKPITFEVFTPLWLFILYICISLLAISFKWAFYLLNLMLTIFNTYIFIYCG